jgi:hypothetical protein
MAPEWFRGVTDRPADIFAVGATLYEMLALRPALANRDHIELIEARPVSFWTSGTWNAGSESSISQPARVPTSFLPIARR